MSADIASGDVEPAPMFHANPELFKLGQAKQHVLAHEIGAGSACRNCDCTGLELHFWRKMCKVCGCRMDQHDVQLPNQYDHGSIIIGRLFNQRLPVQFSTTVDKPQLRPIGAAKLLASAGNGDHSYDTPSGHIGDEYQRFPTAKYNYNISTGNERHKETTEYAWVPVPEPILVEKYMSAFPKDERPIAGSQGEQNRKIRLQYQLPLYDWNVNDARFASEADKQVLNKFVEHVKQNVCGVGQVVEVEEKLQNPVENTSKSDDLHRAEPYYSTVDALGKMRVGEAPAVKCKTCCKEIGVGEVGIQTDHGSKDDIWHPNCFRCHKCDQLIVDMMYFYHQDKYYCGRHFADQQYPRCAGCDELIFAKEYTLAEEKSWHFDHFACYKCDLKLGGHRYMTRDKNPHCIDCYLTHFAKTCDTCRIKIGPDEKRLNYQDVHWHAKEECFRCTQCKKNLIGEKFIMKDHDLFCSAKCKIDHQNKR